MKTKISLKVLVHLSLIVAIGIVIGGTLKLASAWVSSGGNPLADNAYFPLNVSGSGQGKSGGITLNTGGLSANGLIVQNGNVGIGTTSPGAKLDVQGNVKMGQFYFDGNDDTWLRLRSSDNGPYMNFAAQELSSSGGITLGGEKRTAWPSGGGTGTLTSISAGSGITLSPNPIITTGTVATDINFVQRRVSGTCASNQVIRAINADGTVLCSNIVATSSPCTWGGRVYAALSMCNISSTMPCLSNCSGGPFPMTLGYEIARCNTNGTWSISSTSSTSAFIPPAC